MVVHPLDPASNSRQLWLLLVTIHAARTERVIERHRHLFRICQRVCRRILPAVACRYWYLVHSFSPFDKPPVAAVHTHTPLGQQAKGGVDLAGIGHEQYCIYCTLDALDENIIHFGGLYVVD